MWLSFYPILSGIQYQWYWRFKMVSWHPMASCLFFWCCDGIPWQKWLKGQRVYSNSQLQVKAQGKASQSGKTFKELATLHLVQEANMVKCLLVPFLLYFIHSRIFFPENSPAHNKDGPSTSVKVIKMPNIGMPISRWFWILTSWQHYPSHRVPPKASSIEQTLFARFGLDSLVFPYIHVFFYHPGQFSE